MIAWLPEGAVWIITLSLVLLLAGWVSSIVISLKSKWLTLFAVFPLTNPVAIVRMLFKNTRTAMIPIAFYALGLTVWFIGGSRSHKIESKRLKFYEALLAEQGEPTIAADYAITQGNPDENVWEHPFLKPLAVAGQPGSTGETAREQLDQTYERLQLPKSRIQVKYEESSTDRNPMFMPSRKLLEAAIAIKLEANSETPKRDLPNTPSEAAESLKGFFQNSQPDFKQLKEAVSRKNDIYPYAWEEEGFHLLIPHLSKMRSFSLIAHLDSITHSILADQKGSFESAKLAIKLSETGDSDIFPSRWVQMAQLTIALETLVTAQNYHVWNDAQWTEIRSMIDSFDFIQRMPDRLRVERALGRSTFESVLTQGWITAMFLQGNMFMLALQPPPIVTIGIKFLDNITSDYSRAYYTKQWRLYHEATSLVITDLENAAEASKSKPWKDIQISWEDKNLKQHGMFAGMFLTTLDKFQSRAVLHQAKLELAKTAIDLERYFLKHQKYPETLDSLISEFTSSIPLDPMTQTVFAYKQLSKESFEIYSVGLNAKDEGGRNVKKPRRGEAPPADDLLWVISKETKEFPSYSITQPSHRKIQKSVKTK